jgi:hypothetical protein
MIFFLFHIDSIAREMDRVVFAKPADSPRLVLV